MMMRIILYAILILFLYQLIFRLIIPVYRASRRIKKGFREMQDKMNQQYQSDSQQYSNNQPTTTKPPAEDYIEFEEIK